MKATIFTIMLSIALLATGQVWAWDWYPLGGGNAIKIVICDNSDVQGAWCFDKNGGAFWIPWTGSEWGDWQDFDANYCWHMGGDVDSIGPSTGPWIPYALNATMQEHHYYKWENGSWEYGDHLENSYYQYHDAQFFADDNGNTSTQWFLVSTWQLWDEDQDDDSYKRGIYLVSNGQAPNLHAPPAYRVNGTEDKTYPMIHRDLVDKQVFYTWHGPEGNCEFQRIDVAETRPGQFIASLSNDFDETGDLIRIAQGGFYQYLDGETVHQYLLAQTDLNGAQDWKVWHRQGPGGSLGADDWGIIWPDVGSDLDATPQGLAARQQDFSTPEICIFTQDGRLAFYNTESEKLVIRSFQPDSPEAFIAFLSFCFGKPLPQVAGSPLNLAVPCTQLR